MLFFIKHGRIWSSERVIGPTTTVAETLDTTTMTQNATVQTVWFARGNGPGKPLTVLEIFTSVVGGSHDKFRREYRTIGEAKCGHHDVVDMLRARK